MEHKSTLLYVNVKEDLLKLIKTMQFNERIPSRNALVKKYSATRTTIDRAISELIGEGYLYSRDGSGTFVASMVEQPAADKNNEMASWGVILPNIMHDTYPGILRGVEDVASANGISTVICNTDNDMDKEAGYINKLIDSCVKGVVIVPAVSDQNDPAPFRRLLESNTPFVFCNRGVPGIEAPRVSSNSYYGAYIATKYLHSQGYRNIAYVSRPIYSISLERYQGYISAINEAGLSPREDYVIFEDSFEIDRPGYESTKKLLAAHPEVDAIFCFNDAIAKGAYDAVLEAGREIGGGVGIVGYDNASLCEMLPVKLTSVQFQTYDIGTKAAEILMGMMNGESVPKNRMVIVQPELVIRESSQRAETSVENDK